MIAKLLSTMAREVFTSRPDAVTEVVPEERNKSGVAPASMEAARLPDDPNLYVMSHPDSVRNSSVIAVNADDKELAAKISTLQSSAESVELSPHAVRERATTAATQTRFTFTACMVVKM
jgi:hypothetical protein